MQLGRFDGPGFLSPCAMQFSFNLDHYFLCDQIIGTTVASHIVSAEHGTVLKNQATDVADVHGSKLLNKSDVQTENKVKGSYHPH